MVSILLCLVLSFFLGISLVKCTMNGGGLIAKRIRQWRHRQQMQPHTKFVEKFTRRHIALVLLILGSGCTTDIPLQNNCDCVCEPIYGRQSDWENISDDLARNIYKHNLTCEKMGK